MNEEPFLSKKWRMNNLYRIVDREGNSIPFKLNKVQTEVLEGLHTRNLILKARQLGMSTFAIMHILDEALFNPNLSAGIVSYSLEHAQYIFKRIIGHALDTLSPLAKQLASIESRSAREISFKNGSFLRVDTTLRGGAYQAIVVSEFGKTCARNPLKAEEVVTGTLNAISKNSTCIIESTGEGNEGYYADMVHTAVEQGNDNLSPLQYKLFFYPWFDEPTYIMSQKVNYGVDLTDYFDKLEIEFKRKISQDQRNWYAHQSCLLGEKVKQEFPSTISEAFISSSDAYYFQQCIETAYNTNRCLPTPLYDPIEHVYVAMDIGVNDLTVMVFFQVIHGEIRIIDYYEDKNKGVDFYSRFLLQDKKYIYHTIFLPHDAARRDGIVVENSYEKEFRKHFQHTQTHFIVLKLTDKNLNISNAKLKFERCVFAISKVKPLLDQVSRYRKKWSEQYGRYLDEPYHDISCFIGETLIETEQGKKRIDQIIVGDKVLTPKGSKSVLNVFKYKTKNLINISTKKDSITCTRHHKIFSSKGLVNADALCYDDQVLTIEDDKLWKKITSLSEEKKLGFKDCFLSMKPEQLSILMDTNTKKTNLGIGLGELPDLKDMEHCIEPFGFTTTDQLKRDLSFITKTETNQTTQLKTLNLCCVEYINQCTCQQTNADCYLENQFIRHKKQLKNGIVRRTVYYGIKNTERLLLKIKKQLQKFVKYAENLITQNGRDPQCVQIPVEQKTEDYQEKIQKNESVLFAKQNLNVQNLENNKLVQNPVEQFWATEIDVYDLEVEDDHCYFANNILVSNSNYSDALIYALQAVTHIEVSVDTKGSLEKHRQVVQNRLFKF